jgi:hypothetical protein
MRKPRLRYAAGVLLSSALVLPLASQQPAQQQSQPFVPPTGGPAVGEPAPDFDFSGITRFGALSERHKLSDYKGNTVVLAFFPKARTRG